MRRCKKLTRAQRNLFIKNGYKGDLSYLKYIKEDADYIYFYNSDEDIVIKYVKAISSFEQKG